MLIYVLAVSAALISLLALALNTVQKTAEEERESRMQEAVLEIRRKFGKNALLRGMDLQEGATAKDRNSQIGGHRA